MPRHLETLSVWIGRDKAATLTYAVGSLGRLTSSADGVRICPASRYRDHAWRCGVRWPADSPGDYLGLLLTLSAANPRIWRVFPPNRRCMIVDRVNAGLARAKAAGVEVGLAYKTGILMSARYGNDHSF